MEGCSPTEAPTKTNIGRVSEFGTAGLARLSAGAACREHSMKPCIFDVCPNHAHKSKHISSLAF